MSDDDRQKIYARQREYDAGTYDDFVMLSKDEQRWLVEHDLVPPVWQQRWWATMDIDELPK